MPPDRARERKLSKSAVTAAPPRGSSRPRSPLPIDGPAPAGRNSATRSALGQESTDRQGPFVCNVASVQLPGMRRSGEISGIAERQLGSGTEWKTAGEIDPIHPRSGFDAYSD